MLTLTSVEAQNRFGQLLDFAQREPVTITRRGRAVAQLLADRQADVQRETVSFQG
jgi:antitoxin (DNA-binding transcriptional repressor) of toxin-antitoxin stability system